MGIFDGTTLDPALDPATDVWPATLAELARRGIAVHGNLSNLDSGATAVVMKATETDSGRTVAVKVYRNPDQQVVHRNGDVIPMTNFFENERRMLVGLDRCKAVPRYFYSVDAGSALTDQLIQPFHVIEFIDGQKITDFAKQSRIENPNDRCTHLLRLFQQVLEAIGSIHQFGYLHRDNSAGNLLVDKEEQIWLIDLAEASPLGQEHSRLLSVPERGTDGVASEAQQKVRAIQADDVNATCTIGYALFTGQ